MTQDSNIDNGGRLYLVGLGPGDPSLLAPGAAAVLREADVIVGFRGYMEQIASLTAGKEIVSMELGQELERAARAVELAQEGRSVAVVSSGDAGVYGMSGPVFRVLADRNWDGARPEVITVPGISALQSAASLLGSPLMQDFCAISLSDLLTPWEAIRRRLEAAAAGDFVVALYNPRSRRRDWQLLEAREILLRQPHRPNPGGPGSGSLPRRPGGNPDGFGDAEKPGTRGGYVHHGHHRQLHQLRPQRQNGNPTRL